MKKVIVTKLSRAIRHVVSRGAQGPRGGLWGDWSEIPGKPDFDALYDPLGAASDAQSAAAADATAKVGEHASAPDPHPQYVTDADMSSHTGNTANPHSVTKAQVGLGSVDNVSAASLRDRATHTGEQAISTVTGLQAALNSKQPTGSYIAEGDARLSNARPASDVSAWAKAATKPSYAKSEVGLGNVDNTSDANKPVSTAQQAALNLKLNSAEVSSLPTPAAIPRAGTDGKIDPAWIRQSQNDIGTPGAQGFGVGICPAPPAGMSRMAGTLDVASANYGNYQYSDGSIMIWIPAYFYKWGTGANGLPINDVSIKPRHAFATVADANAAGFALHRAFYDGGAEKSGFFVDKYLWSNNGGVASSVAGANPISSAADHNPFSGLSGTPANAYYGAIAVAKTRGADFFCSSRFISSALALLAYAHGRASQSTTYCAWYHATNNFPKGCNNNALRDANDTDVLYTSTGHATYPNCGKTGSGTPFAKTTHNGQACGVCDLNGNLWEITPGITSDGANFYVLKTSAAMKSVTAGTTLATDLWGATGIAAMYDSLGAAYESLAASSTSKWFGSAAQVLSAETSGNAWAAAGAGIPLAGGLGGTNAFGNDVLADYRPNLLCPISGGRWSDTASAGVWALALNSARTYSYYGVGGRSALYL